MTPNPTAAQPDAFPRGVQPETAGLHVLLNQAEWINPLSQKPFTEGELLILGGGLGLGYYLFEFSHSAYLALGLRNLWHQPQAFCTNALQGAGLEPLVVETGGEKTARKQLQGFMEQHQPVLAWLDEQSLPWSQLPEHLHKYNVRLATVVGYRQDPEAYELYDLAEQPFEISGEQLALARKAIGGNKHRLLAVQAGLEEPDVKAGYRFGLEQMCLNLFDEQPPLNFGLTALEKWAELAANERNKKGWPRIYNNPDKRFDLLVNLYQRLYVQDSDGWALRGWFSESLESAAIQLDLPKLKDVAFRYQEAGRTWRDLADILLPEEGGFFQNLHELLLNRHQTRMELGQSAMPELQRQQQKLEELAQQNQHENILNDTWAQHCFSGLKNQLLVIGQAEEVAARELVEVLDETS